MKLSKRVSLILIVVALLLALPVMTALANKQVYIARLTPGAENPAVTNSDARGSFAMRTDVDGTLMYILQVRKLSGPALAAHFHGPATEAQNAGVLITICGNPPMAHTSPCVTDASGFMIVEGRITPSVLAEAGLTGEQFASWLNDGLLYVNVHTALNPGGEVRGQVYPR